MLCYVMECRNATCLFFCFSLRAQGDTSHYITSLVTDWSIVMCHDAIVIML